MDDNVKPKISIIMPVYNLEKYITEAMDSVLNQSFKYFELIIADDGSKDKTREILDKYAKKDKRIVFIKRDTNLGITKNLNDMISIAKSDLIARMDGDDISYPQRLEIEYEYMIKNKKCILAGTWAEMIDKDGKVIHPVKYPAQDWFLRARMLKSDQFIHGSVIFRKEYALKAGGYPPEYKICEDYGLWSRMMKLGRIANIPQILYQWRLHDIGDQTEKLRIQKESTDRLKSEMRGNICYLPEHILLLLVNLYQIIKKWVLKLHK